jgi:hypothetical protein
MKDLFNQEFYFLNNNLYSEKFLKKDIKDIVNFNEDISPQFNTIKELFSQYKLEELNEAQLEDEFIKKVFDILGWNNLYQEIFTIQGQRLKPDFLLFQNTFSKQDFLSNKENIESVSIVCESKDYNTKLDNNKTDKTNPHFQLLNYLMYLKKDYGFLINGQYWRLYDNKKISGNKIFYEVNLSEIIAENDIEAFKYFFHIFKKDNFVKTVPTEKTSIEKISKKSDDVRIEIEENLKDVIYGYNGYQSIFEIIGSNIYKRYPSEDLKNIYENTLYFIFRILFIFYFEDKYLNILTKHKHYNKEVSLHSFYRNLKDVSIDHPDEFTGYRKLRAIFHTLDEGDEAIQVPVFNGGLFAKDIAKLLDNQTLLSNKILFDVLDKILFYQEGGKSLFKRDFKTLSVIQLGSIYEGLLEFSFDVASEQTFYLEIKENNAEYAGHYDTYDYNELIKKKKTKILTQNTYEKGEIYLKSSNNSRKSSASFYTPTSLSSFMVKKAIDTVFEQKTDILSLKIMDNACGSGHFLVEILNYLVVKTLDEININDKITNEKLNTEIAEETEKIKNSLIGFDEKDKEIDQTAVLKRILLKKIIYGVDFNPFAVELTKLSLWIDTFIFGTPLSLLKHHIKTGNSLIGSKLKELEFGETASDLFQNDIMESARELKTKLANLTNLADTTAEDVKKSKRIYDEEIIPLQKQLNLILNYISYTKIRK